MNSAVCMIGPKEALELLKRNTHNRKMSDSVIDKYVIEMRSGQWFATSSGIGFDDRGILTDGQQRLAAIVKFGDAVPMLVVTHLPAKSQMKQDRQRRRTLADVFLLSGICNSSRKVQVATFLASFENGVYSTPADCQVEAALNNHINSINAVEECFTNHLRGIAQVGVRAAIVIAHEIHGKKAIEFAEKVKSEIHNRADDPAFRLRKYLIGETCSRRSVTSGGNNQVLSYRKTIYAFNAWIQGRKINSVHESAEVVPVSETL